MATVQITCPCCGQSVEATYQPTEPRTRDHPGAPLEPDAVSCECPEFIDGAKYPVYGRDHAGDPYLARWDQLNTYYWDLVAERVQNAEQAEREEGLDMLEEKWEREREQRWLEGLE